MDLTPDAVRGIEFRKKGRGYDADDVDAFRQNVESWVGEMQARLREATSKLDQAETRAREAEERTRTNVESDETIQRTLLLAQRTADAAVKEAEETAARKVGDAEAEADRLLNEARTHKERAIADAEADVQQAIDAKRAELLDELHSLERTRDAVANDVALLEVHLESERARLADARDQLSRMLDDPGSLTLAAAPSLSEVEIPGDEPPATDTFGIEDEADEFDDEPRVELADDEADALADPWVAEAPVAADEPEGEAWALGGPSEDEPAEEEPAEEAPAEAPASSWDAPAEEDVVDTLPPPPPPPPPPPDLEVDAAAWAEAPPPPPPPPPDFDAPAESSAPSASFGGLSGPAVPDLADVDEAENPWLAELADEEESAEDGDRSRFGRRR